MNVASVAFVPMTPLLLRHLSGLADPVADLREAAVAAVRDACGDAEQVLVLCPVGGREAPGEWRDPSGLVPGDGSLAAQVAAHVLELAGVTLPSSYVDLVDAEPRVDGGVAAGVGHGGTGATALLVMGDGAAARAEGAPGHVDDRSFGFDDDVAKLLERGDAGALAALDRSLAAELMATGRHTWPVVASLVPTVAEAELRWRGDPFGLSYFVALWRV